MKDIENAMVVDSLWRGKEKEPKKIGECAGCQGDVFAGEDVYEFEDYNVTVLIHQKSDCCMQYIAEMSFCKIAGE
jgi:hypothetical protein